MIVTFSGIDGSGKTTRCEALVRLLRDRGLPAVVSKPAYEANDAVKDFCEWAYGDRFAYFDRLDSDFYISCLTADWLRYLARALSNSKSQILICDRYIYDVVAQAIHMRARATTLRRLQGFFPKPDISFFLEIAREDAFERLRKRAEPKLHIAESLSELHVLHEAYEELRRGSDWDLVSVPEATQTEHLAVEVEEAWHRMQITVST